MKKIKLRFKHDFERFAFYDRAWCHVCGCPQCDECARNPKRYANWNPPGAYTGFGFSDEAYKKAKAGDCHMFEQAKDTIHTKEEEEE
jgi:hypothetical protein